MSIAYGPIADAAAKAIADAGTLVAIRREGDTIDPVTSAPVAGTDTSGTLTALVLPANASKITLDRLDNQYAGDLLVGHKIRFLLAAAKGAPFEPEPGDVVEFEGAEWVVAGCTPLNPGGTALIYRIGVRRQ